MQAPPHSSALTDDRASHQVPSFSQVEASKSSAKVANMPESPARAGTFEVDGIRVVVDPQSIRFVEGAIVDYKDAMMGGGFAISNPNAASSCGCGSSFRPKEEGEEADEHEHEHGHGHAHAHAGGGGGGCGGGGGGCGGGGCG